MDQSLNDVGGRGSPEAWLQAAYESLLQSGVDSVKILSLAKQVGISRTSFYWFFKDREDILDQLLKKWRDTNTGSIVERSEAYAETIVEAMLNVFDCWHGQDVFDARFEFAVRSWGLQSQEVQAQVRLADEQRIDALRRMFVRFGFEPSTADVRARTTYLTQIGYISMQPDEDRALRIGRVHHYVEIFTGVTPRQKDLDRYYHRHGFAT